MMERKCCTETKTRILDKVREFNFFHELEELSELDEIYNSDLDSVAESIRKSLLEVIEGG